jgi:elongation factor G
LARLNGSASAKIQRAEEGDTVAFARLESLITGDRFSDNKKAPEAAPPVPPPPATQAIAIHVKDRKDEVRLAAALAKLCEEDPSLAYVQDQESGELKLMGQGEMHLRVIAERLAERFGVAVDATKPSIAYRETIREGVTVRGRHKKQSGGHGQFGDVLVEVGPRERGEGFAFSERVHGGTVPRQYFSSVEMGARDALTRGPLGFPVVDVAVALVDGSYHTVDSSDMAFRAAAKAALAEALPKARPVLLEPILAVTIYVPSDALARASALVSARRGQILGFEARNGWRGWEALRALIPEAEIGDLIVELRSATSGVGAFETQFDHLAELSGRAADQVIAARKKSLG